MEQYHQKRTVKYVWKKKGYQDAPLVSFTATSPEITTSNHTGEQISSTPSNIRNIFDKKLRSSFGVYHQRIRGIGMERQALKAKQDNLFWSSEKCHKEFSKINDNFKSDLQKWIISHAHVIQSPIENDHHHNYMTPGVFLEKTWKNEHLLGFVPHMYFFILNPFTNICTSFRNYLLY